MEITDRARKLWLWLSDAIENKSDAEIVAHIALAFIEERKIAFRDHGEACAKIADEALSDHWWGDTVGERIREFSAEVSGFPIEGGER